MRGVTLDWSSAEVRDGKLDVYLRGDPPPGWKDSFDRTVALLPGGEWGKVKLKKARLRVHDVKAGSEERLHHFLESAVLQANAAHEPPPLEHDDEPHEDEPDSLDDELTERFRSFATEPQD